nr:hypothetical protein [Escherichia coli]
MSTPKYLWLHRVRLFCAAQNESQRNAGLHRVELVQDKVKQPIKCIC